MKESKSERFHRLIEARVNKAIKMIRLIGNCSTESNYEYTPEQVSQVFDALQRELNAARMKYVAQHKGKKRFSLSDPHQDEKTDEIYPTVYLDLEDGSVLSATAATSDYPSIDINLICPGDTQDEKVAFVEWNKDRESGKELCVGCYRHIGDEPAYYQSYNDEKEHSNDIDNQ